MAYVVHSTQQIGFPTTPVNPLPLGFGFGLSSDSSLSWQVPASSNHSQTTYLHVHQKSTGKRRHDENDDETRDQSMDRSPTPENKTPRRTMPKRIRTSNVVPTHVEGEVNISKSSPFATDNIDVGMLLATLPQESFLPLLTALLAANPSMKPILFELIPRPTIDTALNALLQSAKKLRSAYPYSITESSVQSLLEISLDNRASLPLGGGSSTTISGDDSSSTFGRSFGQALQSSMRDSYVLSRLKPHINEFVSTAFSYLSYFSCVSPSTTSPPQCVNDKKKVIAHPNETFLFLSALTTHICSQPYLTQSSLAPLLLPRLITEWKSWVRRIDTYVNKEGGMFGIEVVRCWESSLDVFASSKINFGDAELESGLKGIRDEWVDRVGWLIGRPRI